MNISATTSKTKGRWQTLWSVAGPKLPYSPVMIGKDIIIAQISPQDLTKLKGAQASVTSIIAPSGSTVTHYPPRDQVESRHIMQIDIDACDEGDAKVLSQIITDRILTSMTLIGSGAQYYAELIKIKGEEDEFYKQHVEYISFSVLPDAEILEYNTIDHISKMMDLIEDNSAAENAYVHLNSAWKLKSIHGSKPLERSILQHYVLCVEVVVNEVMKKIRRLSSDRVCLEEQEFAQRFSEELPSCVDKPSAIRRASAALREISISNTISSIAMAAHEIGVSDEITELAKDLYKFRSRNLSHPGKARREDLNYWLASGPKFEEICLADRVARSFLVKYLDYKLKK
ncbi:hypothetical protein [Ancylobacter lacus]|uniref:hypothetical protein n=1 Tax=Ancylobacter lacus TaxID=2579970 RepID=UPI001BCA7EB7|nr:hypothetical protein [Ancylobacter lacus]MBS7539069.1 hypothetical protein [Ancylobacter lacus]